MYGHVQQEQGLTLEYLQSVGNALRNGSATFVISWPRVNKLGHWYVLAKTLDRGELYLFDAQRGEEARGAQAILGHIRNVYHPGALGQPLDLVLFESIQKRGGQVPVLGMREVPVLGIPILNIPEERLRMFYNIPIITLADTPAPGAPLPPPPRAAYNPAPPLRFGVRSAPGPVGEWVAGDPIPEEELESESRGPEPADDSDLREVIRIKLDEGLDEEGDEEFVRIGSIQEAANGMDDARLIAIVNEVRRGERQRVADIPRQVRRWAGDLTTIRPGTLIQVQLIFPEVVTLDAFYWQRSSERTKGSGYIVTNNDRTVYRITILSPDRVSGLIRDKDKRFVALRFILDNDTLAIGAAYAMFEPTREGGRRGTRKRRLLKGGRVIGGGADTCVVEPYIPCRGFQPDAGIAYVSRLVPPDSEDHRTEAAISQAFRNLVQLRLLAVYSAACQLNRGDAPPHAWEGRERHGGSGGVRAAWQREQTHANPVHWNLITPKYLGTMNQLNTFQIVGYPENQATGQRQLEALITALVPAVEMVGDATNTWIIHTDLHMSNVGVNLIGATMTACLADFGRVLRVENIKSVQSIIAGINAWAQIAFGPVPFGHQARSTAGILNRFANPYDAGSYPQHPANVMAPIRDMYVALTGPMAGQSGPGSQVYNRGISALRGWMVHSLTSDPRVITFGTTEELVNYLANDRYIGFRRAIDDTRRGNNGNLGANIRPSPGAGQRGEQRGRRFHIPGTPYDDAMVIEEVEEFDPAVEAIEDFPELRDWAGALAPRPNRDDVLEALRMIPRAVRGDVPPIQQQRARPPLPPRGNVMAGLPPRGNVMAGLPPRGNVMAGLPPQANPLYQGILQLPPPPPNWQVQQAAPHPDVNEAPFQGPRMFQPQQPYYNAFPRQYGGKSTRRPISLPTRRAGRSSSSSKRNYTHRRRALRTGKGGYRTTRTGRKV
jgi:hypothetical protein